MFGRLRATSIRRSWVPSVEPVVDEHDLEVVWAQ